MSPHAGSGRRRAPTVRLALPAAHEARRIGVLVVVLAAGAGLAVSTAPVWLRAVVALPALVLGPGVALGLLVLPSGTDTDGGDREEAGAAAPATLLWWTLTVLLGLVVVLADALLLNVLRIRLTTLAIAVGLEAVGAGLLVLGQVSVDGRTLAGGARPPVPRPRGAVLGVAVAAVAAAVLIGAVVAAREVQPGTARPYGVLALAGGQQDGQLTATTGEAVTVDWVLRGYAGLDVATAGSPADVTLTDLTRSGGGTSRAVAGHAGAVRVGVGVRAGTTTFTAPAVAGTYRLAFGLSVPAAGGASELDLTANLTVAP